MIVNAALWPALVFRGKLLFLGHKTGEVGAEIAIPFLLQSHFAIPDGSSKMGKHLHTVKLFSFHSGDKRKNFSSFRHFFANT